MKEASKKLAEYRKQIEKHWTGHGKRLSLKNDTELHFDGHELKYLNLSPLRGIPLSSAKFSETPVEDLSPLSGMRLKTLELRNTSVANLEPLRGMPLAKLILESSPISNLEPLQGRPLVYLALSGTKASDLQPLTGMPLRHLNISFSAVSDLSPLAGMPLNYLNIGGTRVTDLSPLAEAPLKKLYLTQRGNRTTPVSNLTPLNDLSLTDFRFDPWRITEGIDIIRKMSTITQIGMQYNGMVPPEEFWEKYDSSDRPRLLLFR